MRQDLRDKEGLTGRIGLEKACEGVDRVSAAKRLGRGIGDGAVCFAGGCRRADVVCGRR